jgi:uncharacterized protein
MSTKVIIPEISDDISPVLSLLKLLGVIIASFFLIQFVLFIGFFILRMDFTATLLALNNPLEHPELENTVLIVQGILHLGIYTFSSLAYLFFVEKKKISSLNSGKGSFMLIPFVICILVMITFVPANSWVIEWNRSLALPKVFNKIEEWLLTKERVGMELSRIMTNITSLPDFILTFLIVAVIGPIGEELLFRGLIQNKFTIIFKSPHMAILTTSILFSAVHLQFLGFFPRLILGLLLGYIYYWSKNIAIPILAHIVNNGTIVVVYYLYHNGFIDSRQLTAKAGLGEVVLSLLIGTGLLFWFWKRYESKHHSI